MMDKQFFSFSRSNQLWGLVILTAFSLTSAYAIQGLLLRHTPAQIPEWLWAIEGYMWAGRALIEAWGLAYLAKTTTRTRWEAVLVWGLKISLLTLIAVTLGPVFQASRLDDGVNAVLSGPHFQVWTYAMSVYAPLMILSAAVAYKVMPHDDEQSLSAVEQALGEAEATVNKQRNRIEQIERQLNAARTESERLTAELNKERERVNEPTGDIEQTMTLVRQALNTDTKAERAALAHSIWPELTQRELAEMVNASTGTVNKALKELNGNGRAH